MTHNQILYAQNKEQQRHNVSVESENVRHNIKTEALQAQANAINKQHYERQDYNQTVANTNLNLNTQYANQTQRMSVFEATRHNMAQESVQYYNARIQAQLAEETQRHNRANEAIANFNAWTQSYAQQSQSALNYANAWYTRGKYQLLPYEKQALLSGTVKDYSLASKNIFDVLTKLGSTVTLFAK